MSLEGEDLWCLRVMRKGENLKVLGGVSMDFLERQWSWKLMEGAVVERLCLGRS